MRGQLGNFLGLVHNFLDSVGGLGYCSYIRRMLKIRVALTEWPANFNEPNIRTVKTGNLSKKL